MAPRKLPFDRGQRGATRGPVPPIARPLSQLGFGYARRSLPAMLGDVHSLEVGQSRERQSGVGAGDAVTTRAAAASQFQYAEEYHEQYLAKNPSGYCGIGGCGVAYSPKELAGAQKA
jgi:hypothetical protein